jgi:CubicO group peptidase (beta-lactamase class C family)
VWYDGRWVVDLWGGWADGARTRPWDAGSLVMPYSVTKPFAAVCVLRLVDAGLVELDAPMSTYWPGLRAPATVRQVLAHTAGVAMLERPAPTDAFYDWARMCALVAEQEPQWTPGDGVGESALLYGHLLGEVVRRTDGRALGRFLREEVCDPHGLDFHVGLGDAELARVVDLTGFDAEFLRGTLAEGRLMGPALSNPPGALDPAVVNGERWRRAEVPAVNGHGTARSVAGLYVALRHGGLLSDRTLEQMLTPTGVGHDRVVGADVSWGLGVALDEDGWGMAGTGGSFGWWSETGGYALGFVTGHVAGHDRGDRVEAALREVLGLHPD